MSSSTITVNAQPVTLVALPFAVATASDVEFQMADKVALEASPFTGQTQAQAWPGSDLWTATLNLPPQMPANSPAWKAFMGEMRGMLNAVQICDPSQPTPRGAVSGTPVCTGADAAGSTVLHTSGWTPSVNGLLLPGDYVQVGYRLHMNLDEVDSDGSGDATLNLWPSLREAPAASLALVTSYCKGLFRLAKNQRGWHTDFTKWSTFQISLVEYR